MFKLVLYVCVFVHVDFDAFQKLSFQHKFSKEMEIKYKCRQNHVFIRCNCVWCAIEMLSFNSKTTTKTQNYKHQSWFPTWWSFSVFFSLFFLISFHSQNLKNKKELSFFMTVKLLGASIYPSICCQFTHLVNDFPIELIFTKTNIRPYLTVTQPYSTFSRSFFLRHYHNHKSSSS